MEEISENSICQNKDKRRGKKESGVALYDIKGLHSGYCRFAHIKRQVVTESMVIKYVPENYTMDGIRCDIAIGFGQLGKIIATGNTRDDLMDERELAKYIVDNETISENENIECRR